MMAWVARVPGCLACDAGTGTGTGYIWQSRATTAASGRASAKAACQIGAGLAFGVRGGAQGRAVLMRGDWRSWFGLL